MKSLYLNNKFFFALFGVGICYVLAFFFPVMMWIANSLLIFVLVLTAIDGLIIFINKEGINAQRILPEKLSNGDENSVKVDIINNYNFNINTKIIDEIPFQFQKRDFLIKKNIESGNNTYFEYILEPKERGEYSFGNLNVYVNSPIGLVSRRFTFQKDAKLASYP